MLTTPRDDQTVDRLQSLLNDTFEARDTLQAAANRLRDSDRRTICRWLANRMGGHAATLQQVIAASGVHPAEPHASGRVEKEIEFAQAEGGDAGVMNAAEKTEQRLVTRYDATIERLHDREVQSLLSQHRSESEFADCVLRKLAHVA